ncbi:hypothetical protein SAMN04515695_0396 [Pseudovibrio sp. Tun.PSC04-5.I4]|nr:hypothetical protein SAMN04515695_0396 [Pseudovibrio sp. Tun.PSC04-5.I4]
MNTVHVTLQIILLSDKCAFYMIGSDELTVFEEFSDAAWKARE